MTTAGKLWLGYGLLLALLVGTGLFVAHRLTLIDRALVTIMAVQEPATAATYEMAINVVGTRASVLHYVESGDPAQRTRVRELVTEFTRDKMRFDQVARSRASRDLGRRMDVVYARFRRLGDSLMTASDLRRSRTAAFGRHSEDLLTLVDPGLRAHLDTKGKEGQRRIADVARIESDIGGLGATLGHYLRTREARDRARITFHQGRFQEAVADLRSTRLNDDERRRLCLVETAFGALAAEAGATLDAADLTRGLFEQFAGSGTEVGELVDESIHSLARTDLIEAQRQARRAIRTSLIAVLLLLVAGIVIGSGTAIPTGRSIVRADQNLRERMRELADAHQRKDEFLGVLGHELRNPLAPLSNALNALEARGDDVPEDVRNSHLMMMRQVRSMKRLVDELLDVSRINQGKITLRREPVDMAKVVVETADDLGPQLDAHHHKLKVTRPTRPAWVYADPTRLAQVTANLLQNAIKYTPDGGRIGLEVETRDGQVVLRVSDNGIGIPAEMLPLVFEPFVQGDHSTARTDGGLGIGLTLVNRLVELHGGRTTVESPGPGRGSPSTVRLPVAPAPYKTAPARPAQTATVSRRILVVDDNRDSAESMAALLELWGHKVVVAHDGPTALAATAKHDPDLAFLDIGLPGMDGYEVARHLRTQQGGAGRILIALTGLGREEDRRRALEAGFDRHLTKPVNPETLQGIVSTGAVQPT